MLPTILTEKIDYILADETPNSHLNKMLINAKLYKIIIKNN